LKQLLRDHDVRLEDMPVLRIPDYAQQHLTPQQEEALFRHAMEDVHPLPALKTAEICPLRPLGRRYPNEEDDVLKQLQSLIACGQGYRVADTPEYIEGKGLAVPDEMVRRLHQGAFSIQDHIDLHRMGVMEAREAVEKLLAGAVKQGLRTVLIIHGRGLSSPGEPVLKSRLVEWLDRSAWRKWILAYASARACDGGAGATYVLLRSRAMTKRLHNRRRRNGRQ
jgi:DNA-nicking Smr family endonuclease